MGLLFYKPKHMKQNPTIVRIKNIPHWILNECIEYSKWYIQLIISLCKVIWLLGEKILEYGIKAIDWIDNFNHELIKEFLLKILPKIKFIFEKFKNFCYNIYRKLKKN